MKGQKMRKLWTVTLAVVAVVGLAGGCASGRAAVNGDFVRVHYTGTLSDGSQFDSSEGRDPLEFTLGAGQMIPGFEDAVRGMKVGEKKTVAIPASEAYGERNEDLVVQVSFEDSPELVGIEVGQQIRMSTPGGQTFPATVTEVTSEGATVDANHRLAGEDLSFEIRLVEIR